MPFEPDKSGHVLPFELDEVVAKAMAKNTPFDSKAVLVWIKRARSVDHVLEAMKLACELNADPCVLL